MSIIRGSKELRNTVTALPVEVREKLLQYISPEIESYSMTSFDLKTKERTRRVLRQNFGNVREGDDLEKLTNILSLLADHSVECYKMAGRETTKISDYGFREGDEVYAIKENTGPLDYTVRIAILSSTPQYYNLEIAEIPRKVQW